MSRYGDPICPRCGYSTCNCHQSVWDRTRHNPEEIEKPEEIDWSFQCYTAELHFDKIKTLEDITVYPKCNGFPYVPSKDEKIVELTIKDIGTVNN